MPRCYEDFTEKTHYFGGSLWTKTSIVTCNKVFFISPTTWKSAIRRLGKPSLKTESFVWQKLVALDGGNPEKPFVLVFFALEFHPPPEVPWHFLMVGDRCNMILSPRKPRWADLITMIQMSSADIVDFHRNCYQPLIGILDQIPRHGLRPFHHPKKQLSEGISW